MWVESNRPVLNYFSTVGLRTLGYCLDVLGTTVRLPAKVRSFSLLQIVRNSPNPPFSDFRCFSFWGKVARVVIWSLTSNELRMCGTILGSADKSLAQPGRKQAIANKLGIYSTYSQRSSIHFLARCTNFYKPLKKNSAGCPSNQVSAAAVTSASEEKWTTFSCFFQSREQVVVRRGQILRIVWVIKTLAAQVGQFLLGCKCLGSRGIVVQEQDHLGDLTEAGIFPSKCLLIVLKLGT